MYLYNRGQVLTGYAITTGGGGELGTRLVLHAEPIVPEVREVHTAWDILTVLQTLHGPIGPGDTNGEAIETLAGHKATNAVLCKALGCAEKAQ